MGNRLLASFSYIFHPLFVPLAGTVAYFLIAPFGQGDMQYGKMVLPIFILTILVPIFFFLLLKRLKLISSIFAPTRRERLYPFLFGLAIQWVLLYQVLPQYGIAAIYFYFLGLTLSLSSALLVLFFKIKASVHMMGMGGILFFLVGLSVHFETNITLALSILTLFAGLVGSSRLYLKVHTSAELLVGFLLGGCAQLVLFRFWL